MEASKLFCLFCVIIPLIHACSISYTVDTRTISGIVRDVWGCGNASLPGAVNILTGQYYTCGSHLNSGVAAPICTVANSGFQCAQDFERASEDDLGLVQNIIGVVGTDRVPLYNNSKTHPTVINTDQFSYWYRDLDTFNIPISVDLTVSNADTCDSLLFQYDNQNFYPIDGEGFGNYYNGHNYGFTYASNMRFTYQGYETFEFTGDDDVFVFINDQLALDLGGVHGAESATIDLTYPSAGCSAYTWSTTNPPLPCVTKNGATSSIPCACILGIVAGSSYNFDLYYNERHTSASDLKFTTSLFLSCPWYDWCGVCQGNGQSCCTCEAPNACYTPKCNVTSGACINTAVDCGSPIDACHAVSCNTSSGKCESNSITCNDNDACTDDSCDTTNGCSFVTKNCDDSNPCTIDSCNSTTGCVHTTVSECNPLCSSLVCPDSNACISWECNYLTGTTCDNKTTTCDDGNACTTNSCDNSTGCVFTTISCDDGNPCTVDTCNSTTGCVHTAVYCDDLNACTNDTCDVTSGNCTYTEITVPAGDFCTGIYCDPTVGIVKTTTACPSSCEAACDPSSGCQKCPGSRWTPTVKAAVGIGAGAIAGIAIGGAAAVGLGVFGGKKGYDVYMRNRNNMNGAQANPMYTDNGRTGQNPFYA